MPAHAFTQRERAPHMSSLSVCMPPLRVLACSHCSSSALIVCAGVSIGIAGHTLRLLSFPEFLDRFIERVLALRRPES